MTASSTLAAVGRGDGRWTRPLDAGEFDTTIGLRGNERRAIAELGSVNLRRLQRQDAVAPGWSAVRRLLRPLDAVNAALDSPPTSHRRRAMGDAVAVIRQVAFQDLRRAGRTMRCGPTWSRMPTCSPGSPSSTAWAASAGSP